jgi:putative ABC transport system substrate-binding protein
LADPVRQGLVASYARPGGNLTGVLVAIDGLWNKYLELARELVPGATTIGLVVNPSNPGNAVPRHDVETAGTATGIKIVVVEARATIDFEPAFKALIAAGVQAVIVGGDALFVSEHKRLAELATASRLPSVSGTRELTEAGGIISYSVSNSGNFRRAAYFVDKILKGTKPADLPVEFPTTLEMIVNMKAAKALGITIPPTLLARADEVIE